eukprot:CAMPEP_0195304128 /NCGR_PEP_ID=MMETSP0707-20130614/33911_1 /TAXON_ID=33640 /ORGANISM="Asterionellopsis glacialis, Strain CCMP134" /LENGTH=528 /DNA_ID=CAMNT_0040367847 /DNA_START=52 /DNA_END=1638 /DNA_ORIENTATION=-
MTSARALSIVLLTTACVSSVVHAFTVPQKTRYHLLSNFPVSISSRTEVFSLTRIQFRSTVLSMARRSSPGGGNKKKKKKQSGGNSKNKNKRNPKQGKSSKQNSNKSLHETEKSRTETKAAVALPSLKTRAPPWQVLSAKDAKKNVAAEKNRRDRIRQGLAKPNEELDFDDMEQPATLSKALLGEADRQLLSWKRFNPSTAPNGMTFVGSYLERRLPPRLGVPEIAFLGRSNVGKSSLLNCLTTSARQKGAESNQKDQARVGKTPGATASVNMYVMTGKRGRRSVSSSKPLLGFADLPGFGYARLSKDIKEQVQEAAERYLEKRQELALGILLVDARRTPSDDDRAVLAALYDMGVPLVVVATKVDKLSNNERDSCLETVRDGLGLPDGQPFCVSSATGEGTKDLWTIILEACETCLEDFKNKLEKAGSDDDDDDGDLDEDGDDDIQYDMGYDWIHDSGVIYEGDADDEVGYSDNNDQHDGDYFDDDHDDDYTTLNTSEQKEQQAAIKEAFKMKNLKQRVRDMEKRGEL